MKFISYTHAVSVFDSTPLWREVQMLEAASSIAAAAMLYERCEEIWNEISHKDKVQFFYCFQAAREGHLHISPAVARQPPSYHQGSRYLGDDNER